MEIYRDIASGRLTGPGSRRESAAQVECGRMGPGWEVVCLLLALAFSVPRLDAWVTGWGQHCIRNTRKRDKSWARV
ncbi:hypothetical protein CERZMDRAFT_120997 [Cercospora zeae-maydis SCOH1-5]|uniref:Uncharacterized protein n=1 Tax=Cercospora zeae-maydis SCOH1-5 TaxID=717836 RepID=A0A6A6FIA7_9PEZI|nr:hypothetical protein CERZMDRAFT_120997 [Cercospora zeae-maydis SCOH1-5]